MSIVINGSGTLSGLAVGGLPDGTVDAGTLATDSVTAAKLEVSAITSADLPAGSVLQVVSTSVNTQTNVSSQSFSNISTEATITPKFSNSKILITFNSGVCYQNTANATYYFYGSFFRGSTNIANNSSYPYVFGSYQGGLSFGDDHGFTMHGQKLDSPSTTNAVTYKVMCLNQTANLEVVINYKGESCMTLMEIAG